MSSPKKNEAVQDAVVHVRGKSANNGAHGTGLAAEDTALGRRRGLGGPQKTEGGLPPRRASLAPTAFSFGGVRNGRIAPAVYLQVCGLTPCGNSSELPLPSVRSANPHGVALPLAGENDSRNLTEAASWPINHPLPVVPKLWRIIRSNLPISSREAISPQIDRSASFLTY